MTTTLKRSKLFSFYICYLACLGNQGEQQKGIKQTAAKADSKSCVACTEEWTLRANTNSKTRGYITQDSPTPSVRAKWSALAAESVRHSSNQSRRATSGHSA